MQFFVHRRWIVGVGALMLLLSTGISAQIADGESTVLGAVADNQIQTVMVGNRQVLIYQAARNSWLRQRTQFADVTLYYVAPPTVGRLIDGSVDVRINPSIVLPGKSYVQFKIVPAEIDRSSLLASISKIDTYVRPENVLPIQIFALDVTLLDAPTIIFPQGNATPFDTPFVVGVLVDSDVAHTVSNSLQNGAAIQVGYLRLVKLSQLTSTSLKWSEVKNTKTFRDYDGPSGPSMLSATQVVDAALSILSELKVFHWEEDGARDSGGATSKDYGLYLDKIVDRFLVSRTSKLADFDAWVNTRRFDIPLNEFQKMVDETRSVATDAKNLNDNQWCRKYSDTLRTLDESASGRDSPHSYGLKMNIPLIGDFGLDARESTVHSSSKNTYEKLSSSEDCGRKIVENNYKYEWAGIKYIPKSIKVYERNKVAGRIDDSEEIIVYRIGQQLKRNVWSISSN